MGALSQSCQPADDQFRHPTQIHLAEAGESSGTVSSKLEVHKSSPVDRAQPDRSQGGLAGESTCSRDMDPK